MAKGGVKYVGEGESVYSAMRTMLERRVGSLVVKDDSERVTGFVTTRDLMRCVIHRGVLWNGSTEPQHWNVPISKIMTPSKDLVFLSPKDSLDDARALMSLSGKRHIPVISGSTMLGIITPKDIAHALHLEMDKGQTAKASYVTTVMPRMGMPLGTRLIDDGTEQTEQSYSLRSAVCNLPHPHKETAGEDAFLLGPYMVGVADGVGSWWEADIDPAIFARGLMEAASTTCISMRKGAGYEALRRPQQVLHEAWRAMQRMGTIGSATACLVALHPVKSELLAANVGDSGFIIIRRLGSNPSAMGTLDAMGAKTPEGSSGHHVAFRSPQQLRAFNAPFQLGRAPDSLPGEPDKRFETPHDAAYVRVPIQADDIIVLATDGLYDNLTEEEVLTVIAENEEATEEDLAHLLAERAREMSLRHDIDSPFAVLAKDNDILWGGGRPDDTTVIVSRIVDRISYADGQTPPTITGPGPPPPETVEAEPTARGLDFDTSWG